MGLRLCRQDSEKLIRQELKSPGQLAVAAQSIKKIATELAQWINPFENRSEIETDVVLPSAASRWRTVISGTLGVLNNHVAALCNIQQTLLDALESLLDALKRSDISKRYEFECFALSDYPQAQQTAALAIEAGLSPWKSKRCFLIRKSH